MLKCWLHVGVRAGFAFQIKRVAAFEDTPAVVVTLVYLVNLFPQILTVVSYPDVAGLRVGRVPVAPRERAASRLRETKES